MEDVPAGARVSVAAPIIRPSSQKIRSKEHAAVSAESICRATQDFAKGIHEVAVVCDLLDRHGRRPRLHHYSAASCRSTRRSTERRRSLSAVLAATYAFCQLVSGPFLGRISDKYGRRPILMLSQAGTFVGFVLLGVANSLPLIFISRIIDGVTAGNLTIAQAAIADVTPPEGRAKAFGIIGIAFGLGFIVGPGDFGGPRAHRRPLPSLRGGSRTLCDFNVFATWKLLPESTQTVSSLGKRQVANQTLGLFAASPHALAAWLNSFCSASFSRASPRALPCLQSADSPTTGSRLVPTKFRCCSLTRDSWACSLQGFLLGRSGQSVWRSETGVGRLFLDGH
jgi:MFS family permease